MIYIFDADGTLFDSSRLSYNSLATAFKARGLRVPMLYEWQNLQGLCFDDCMKRLLGNYNYSAIEKDMAEFQIANIHKIQVNEKALEKIRELDCKIGVVSARKRKTLAPMLAQLGVKFHAVVYGEKKPSAAGIKRVMKKLDSEHAIYVGDTRHDAECARLAGVEFVHIKEFEK